nr:glycosyltransferase [Methanobacterium formicicum]
MANGFDEKIFYPINQDIAKYKLNLPKNLKIILSIGNIVEIKGHNYLISAIDKIKSDCSELLVIIIGKGNPNNLKKQIIDLKLDKHVKIINGVPHDEIPMWINACDLFVLPSLDEGSPTVIPEALACGKPVIATRVATCQKLLIMKN